MVRNTVQRALTLEAVKKLACHPTADQVYALVSQGHPSISRATVYRNLNQLVEDGELKAVQTAGGPTHFDHTLYDHYHVKCLDCGKVDDVDMETVEHLEKHIKNPNGYVFYGYEIAFRGVCESCQRKKENEQ